jgi:hypothetical protein
LKTTNLEKPSPILKGKSTSTSTKKKLRFESEFYHASQTQANPRPTNELDSRVDDLIREWTIFNVIERLAKQQNAQETTVYTSASDPVRTLLAHVSAEWPDKMIAVKSKLDDINVGKLKPDLLPALIVVSHQFDSDIRGMLETVSERPQHLKPMPRGRKKIDPEEKFRIGNKTFMDVDIRTLDKKAWLNDRVRYRNRLRKAILRRHQYNQVTSATDVIFRNGLHWNFLVLCSSRLLIFSSEFKTIFALEFRQMYIFQK